MLIVAHGTLSLVVESLQQQLLSPPIHHQNMSKHTALRPSMDSLVGRFNLRDASLRLRESIFSAKASSKSHDETEQCAISIPTPSSPGNPILEESIPRDSIFLEHEKNQFRQQTSTANWSLSGINIAVHPKRSVVGAQESRIGVELAVSEQHIQAASSSPVDNDLLVSLNNSQFTRVVEQIQASEQHMPADLSQHSPTKSIERRAGDEISDLLAAGDHNSPEPCTRMGRPVNTPTFHLHPPPRDSHQYVETYDTLSLTPEFDRSDDEFAIAGKDMTELLSCINITRANAGNNHSLALSQALCTRAEEVATDSDGWSENFPAHEKPVSRSPECGIIWFDEDTSTAELIGTRRIGGLATGELWAACGNKRHKGHDRCTHVKVAPGLLEAHCPCSDYAFHAAIIDETWRYIGIAESPHGHRWVAIVSELKAIKQFQSMPIVQDAPVVDQATPIGFSLQSSWDDVEDLEDELHVPRPYPLFE